MTQFFLSVHQEKKLSHFDLKTPNFLGQNDSIFRLIHREKYFVIWP